MHQKKKENMSKRRGRMAFGNPLDIHNKGKGLEWERAGKAGQVSEGMEPG